MVRTTNRNIRIPDALWQAAKQKAGARGVSHVIVTLLTQWVEGEHNLPTTLDYAQLGTELANHVRNFNEGK